MVSLLKRKFVSSLRKYWVWPCLFVLICRGPPSSTILKTMILLKCVCLIVTNFNNNVFFSLFPNHLEKYIVIFLFILVNYFSSKTIGQGPYVKLFTFCKLIWPTHLILLGDGPITLKWINLFLFYLFTLNM